MTTGEQAISRRSAPRIAVFVVLAGLVGGVVTGTPAWAADDPAGLQVDTATSTEVAYGNTATWSFTVTNTGTRATAGPVTMAFQYNQGSNPPDAAILSAWDQAKVTSTSGTCSLSTQKRTGTCVTGALRPGQSVTMTTTARQHFASSGFTGWGFTVVRGKSDPDAPWNARYSGTTLVPVRGNLDRVLPVSGGVQVAGWVVELERLADPMTVTAQVDGVYTDRFTTTVRRADVNRALHVSGNRGFAGTVAMSAGTHRLCLTASDPYWGSSTIDFGCRNVQVR
ncbi:hypothetical protein HUN58_10315 [Curtobacterium sp. Csp1]|uniref:hypothetical protein n=1 Tax=unclassified Curtobacterium TaxID=257496 RepID=UPI001598B35B|nr:MULTISPECIES: hypothetical protein [unclassified Curtobacterium]QKS12673.1 hypothetical protein HUN60_05600 [Curtobacterium sp. csp3]QKS20279.1 hypothetical protein HUN58_10315 [Curtobacterium sp. Csp1]